MISVINTGSGNINSILNMLNYLGHNNILSYSVSDFSKSKYLVLPGVGNFDNLIQNLRERKILDYLKDETNFKNKYLIGICVGMQVLFEKSEEGNELGLGLLKGEVVKINSQNVRVPHMGWNEINAKGFVEELDNKKFYFAHSYYACCDNKYIFADFNYGAKYPAIVKNKNIIGIQFHPEKSHKNGMMILNKLLSI